MNELVLRNRQRVCRVNHSRLRSLTRHLIEIELEHPDHELGIHLVGDREITRINEQFLQHAGPTDIITFDYGAETGTAERFHELHGEIFICMPEAIRQAERYRTTWQMELTRYLIHGLLHLLGYDDQQPAARRKMKQQENRLLRRLSRQFDPRQLGP